MTKKREESKKHTSEILPNQPFPVHLTESLATGMTKQFREDANERLRLLKFPRKNQRRRTWLSEVESDLRKAFPGELLVHMSETGKGKDRTMYMSGLVPGERDWVIFCVVAESRTFRLRSASLEIFFTKHLIERLFLRLATIDPNKVARAIRPVASFLALNHMKFVGTGDAPEELQILTDIGRFTVEVQRETEGQALSLVVLTFLYFSQLNARQQRMFVDVALSSTERVHYVDIRRA